MFSSDRRVVPWRSAPQAKGQPIVERDDVARLVAGPPALADLGPRAMFATQTYCVASHVAYYLTPEWARTGRTSADPGVATNRYPLVWIDGDGRQILLGGHHRSLAAVIEGRPVRCRVLRHGDEPLAVLPLLLAGPMSTTATLGATSTDDSDQAAALVAAVRTVLVPDLAVARRVLERLGLDGDVGADRLAMATTGRCQLGR